MTHTRKIGVLAFHGDVIEHIQATKKAAEILKLSIDVLPIRTKESIRKIDGLIIPGGESTTLHKLCEREDMWQDMKKIKNIFGTCAGAILLAKTIYHKTEDQETLALMDMEIDRNAYGRQTESFETPIVTSLGEINAIFIRAPKILKTGKEVKVLAKLQDEIIACEQQTKTGYYIALCFHPELTTTVFHEYFLRTIYSIG